MKTFITIAGLFFTLLGQGISAQTSAPAERSYAAPAALTAQEINALFEIALWQDDNLWDDDVQDTAQRLRWRKESETSLDASYRLYPPAEYHVLGTRPFSLALYAKTGTVFSVSMVFANKGDSVITLRAVEKDDKQLAKAAKDSLKDYQRAIRADAATIRQRLEQALGKPQKDRFGQGAKTRERVDRWDWNGHAILLSAPHDEYVRVQVVPAAYANTEGAAIKMPDSELKKLLALRIKQRPNGDVVLTDIPMVWQGDKGYCVPATWERYLRYLGIPADMYVLAMASGAKPGGGTYFDLAAGVVLPLAQKYNRSLESFKRPLATAEIAKYIDKGLPLIWSHYHIEDAFNEALTERMAQRDSAPSPAAWKESVQGFERDAAKIKINTQYAHCCMIIGYNKLTDEIAISDSWGPAFAERWITQKEAKAISTDHFNVIRW